MRWSMGLLVRCSAVRYCARTGARPFAESLNSLNPQGDGEQIRSLTEGLELPRRINWFPGHMNKSLREMRQQVTKVDFVVEVRDARLPFASGNPDLVGLGAKRKQYRRIVILNKADLANPLATRHAIDYFAHEEGVPAYAVSCARDHHSSLKGLVQRAIKSLRLEQHREFDTVAFTGMVVGMPNVGKSSLINQLRVSAHRSTGNVIRQGGRAKPNREGPDPGVTRSISRIVVSRQPECLLLDTPGIVMPRIPSTEIGLRMCAAYLIKDDIVPREVVAEYVLRFCNQDEGLREKYVQFFGLDRPALSLEELSDAVEETRRLRQLRPVQPEDIPAMLLAAFRKGKLGRATLEDVPVSPYLEKEETDRHKGDATEGRAPQTIWETPYYPPPGVRRWRDRQSEANSGTEAGEKDKK
eukprot:TRINITY_DN7446_c0_g1_i1.p1 TRINITY_DN7446_c0_g1~~TRINITY_DN7446_c0_g1_i1.p1  ORF type:complete len:412 (+),score=62.78 TRINITY_DN7446_c0_g1_i1:51-1286(+)